MVSDFVSHEKAPSVRRSRASRAQELQRILVISQEVEKRAEKDNLVFGGTIS